MKRDQPRDFLLQSAKQSGAIGGKVAEARPVVCPKSPLSLRAGIVVLER